MSPTPEEINAFGKQSRWVIERTPDQKVTVKAAFVFKDARYELEGSVDEPHKRIEPFQHKLIWRGDSIYELRTTFGRRTVHAEYRFGKATSGTRVLVVNAERAAHGALATGSADGDELVPHRIVGCGCSIKNANSSRPVLAWSGPKSTRLVSLKLPHDIGSDLEGLAVVMQQAIARSADGDDGSILTDLEFVLCWLTCTVEQFFCWIGTLGWNDSDVRDQFQILCSVIYGGCINVCTIQSW